MNLMQAPVQHSYTLNRGGKPSATVVSAKKVRSNSQLFGKECECGLDEFGSGKRIVETDSGQTRQDSERIQRANARSPKQRSLSTRNSLPCGGTDNRTGLRPINSPIPSAFSPQRWTGGGFAGNPERHPANPIEPESCCLVPLVGDGVMLIGGRDETGADLGGSVGLEIRRCWEW